MKGVNGFIQRVRFRFGIRRRKGGIVRKINNKGRDFLAELS